MKPNYTQIAFVLDRSGSMEPIRDDTIGGVNRYFDNVRQGPGSYTVTLAQFDNVYDLIYNRVPLEHVAPRTRENYVPRSWTALHDAIGRTIDDVGAVLVALPEHERPERVLFVTMTDGEENASRTFTAADVRAKIEHQRTKYGWEFVFLGANQDAVLAAERLGIRRGASISYAANATGTAAVMDSLSRVTNHYGATGQSVNFASADRMAQYNAGAAPDAAAQDAANDPVFDVDKGATGTA